MTSRTVRRNVVVQRWGTPHVTIGSANEAREMEEHGHHFNEKWVYHLAQTEPNQPKERVIYWHRYDFVAAYLVNPNGIAVREDPARILSALPDRR